MRARHLILLALLPLLAACSTATELARDKARYITDTVCALPDLERQLLRQEIDAITSPHKIRVECGP